MQPLSKYLVDSQDEVTTLEVIKSYKEQDSLGFRV